MIRIDKNELIEIKMKEKYNYTCQKCGATWESTHIGVSHIDGNPNNYNEENLIVLCELCHHEMRARIKQLVDRGKLPSVYEHWKIIWNVFDVGLNYLDAPFRVNQLIEYPENGFLLIITTE